MFKKIPGFDGLGVVGLLGRIFSNLDIFEKYLQNQQDLYHVFIEFKKAFDRVWHAALWATMRHFNINTNLIRMIQNLYDKATSAVYLNNSIGTGSEPPSE